MDKSLEGQLEKALIEEITRDVLLDNDTFFMHAYVPHKLDNIEHFERDDEVERQKLEVMCGSRRVGGPKIRFLY